MKQTLAFLFVFLVLCSGALAQATPTPLPAGSFSTYYGPDHSLRVTITSEDGVVSVLNVPPGVFLNVVATKQENPGFRESTGFPRTFRGDLTIRTRRRDATRGANRPGMREYMAESPLEMTLKDAVVLLEAAE